ncbi:amino acid ABC transporter permease, partial [Butyricicoccus sp. 1XD8-22]
DSSLVTVIAANDILFAAKMAAGATFSFWEPYLAAALLYLILTYVLTKVIGMVEKRFSNDYNPRKNRREGRLAA